MGEVLCGIVTAVAVTSLGIAYIYKQIHAFDANLHALLNVAGKNLKPGSDARVAFDKVKEEARIMYKLQRKKRVRKSVWGFILIGAILGLFALCVSHFFLGRVRPSLGLFPIPLLTTTAFMCFVYLLNSHNCCVFRSEAASDPKVWLGVILPSIPVGGDLKVVLGSMNPYPFSEKWLFDALVWLHSKKRVNLQILSGEPEWEKMNSDQLKKLRNFWANITKHGLQDHVRILPERPQLQFTLTNKLVRIEKDHASWIEREKEREKRKHDINIPNHIHLFDYFLIFLFRYKFKRLWQSAEPAVSVLPIKK